MHRRWRRRSFTPSCRPQIATGCAATTRPPCHCGCKGRHSRRPLTRVRPWRPLTRSACRARCVTVREIPFVTFSGMHPTLRLFRHASLHPGFRGVGAHLLGSLAVDELWTQDKAPHDMPHACNVPMAHLQLLRLFLIQSFPGPPGVPARPAAHILHSPAACTWLSYAAWCTPTPISAHVQCPIWHVTYRS